VESRPAGVGLGSSSGGAVVESSREAQRDKIRVSTKKRYKDIS